MLDDLKFDRKTFPATGYLGNLLLTTQAGFRWCLDFFFWVRGEVESGKMEEEVAFLKFKEALTNSFSKLSRSQIDPQKVDWTTLFNFIEEKTRPDDNDPLFPKIILRAPSKNPKKDQAQANVKDETIFQSNENIELKQNRERQETFKDISTPRRKNRGVDVREDIKFIFSLLMIVSFLGAMAVALLPDVIKALVSNIGEIAEFIIFALIFLGVLAFLGTAIETIFGSKSRDVKAFYSTRYPNNWDSIRKTVLKRDGYRCGNCGSTQNLHVHHIVPLSKGGTNNISNLRSLCSDCHKKIHPHMR